VANTQPLTFPTLFFFLHRRRANQRRQANWNSPGIATLVKDGRLTVSSSLWMPRVRHPCSVKLPWSNRSFLAASLISNRQRSFLRQTHVRVRKKKREL
jgi:hypothetical protein